MAPTADYFFSSHPSFLLFPLSLSLGNCHQKKQNGNLTNTPHLNYYLDHYAHRHINTSSDSELLLNLLADALQKTGKFRIDADDIFRAVRDVMHSTSGAYACTMMIAGYGIVGFRDPNGIRPMGWCRRKSTEIEGGWDYLMASESVVCDALGFQDWKDVAPGSFLCPFCFCKMITHLDPPLSISSTSSRSPLCISHRQSIIDKRKQESVS